MANKMLSLFNNEFLKRIFSALFFVPLMIVPILYSNYLLTVIYLIFCSIVIIELSNIKLNSPSKYIFSCYIVITVLTYHLFILVLIAEPIKTYFILEIIFTIWLFDTFSFLGGKLIGGMKLIPRISKGKTVSGLISGIFCSFIIIQSLKYIMNIFSITDTLHTLLIIILAFIGDIIASILKRKANMKDSGNIMPGHGGLFDRFDSFIAVFFFYGLSFIIL